MGEGVAEFSKVLKKGVGSDFSHKNGGLAKIDRAVPKKRKGVSLIFIVTNPLQGYLSLNVRCVCILLIYTISIICVSQEEPSLTASNQ